MKKFRFRSGSKASYDRQGLVWFTMRRYDGMTDEKKRRVERVCQRAAGHNWKALLAYMTTDKSPEDVAAEYYIASVTTIYQAVNRLLEKFPDDLL